MKSRQLTKVKYYLDWFVVCLSNVMDGGFPSLIKTGMVVGRVAFLARAGNWPRAGEAPRKVRLPWGIQIDVPVSKALSYRNVSWNMFITIYLIKCLYSLQYTHKYLAGKSAMKEDAVPVGKVDLHHYVSLRAFAIPYYIACGFRDWSPNQSRVCSEDWLFVSRNPYMHNRWPWPAIIGSQKCLSQRRWQVFAALWRALLEISHCTHGKQRLGAHFFGKWWWNDSEGNLFQLRTTVIPNFGREVSKFRFKRS